MYSYYDWALDLPPNWNDLFKKMRLLSVSWLTHEAQMTCLNPPVAFLVGRITAEIMITRRRYLVLGTDASRCNVDLPTTHSCKALQQMLTLFYGQYINRFKRVEVSNSNLKHINHASERHMCNYMHTCRCGFNRRCRQLIKHAEDRRY